MYFAMKMTYPFHISKQQFEYCMGLFLINQENKSHYVYIKVYNRFMFIKAKHKTKNTFADIVHNVLVVKGF